MTEHDQWLSQVTETILDPKREIVDPHHHLWQRSGWNYELAELWADTGAGHNVVQTVFLECGSIYRTDGPEHLQSVGETDYVADIAAASRHEPGSATIAAIVARADLRCRHPGGVQRARGSHHWPDRHLRVELVAAVLSGSCTRDFHLLLGCRLGMVQHKCE